MTNQERYEKDLKIIPVGFDCMHFRDWNPLSAKEGLSSNEDVYRDTEFVLNEIKNIIKQLKEKQNEKTI